MAPHPCLCGTCAAVPVVSDPVRDGSDFAPVIVPWRLWTHRQAVEAQQAAPQGGELTAAVAGGVGGHVAKVALGAPAQKCGGAR